MLPLGLVAALERLLEAYCQTSGTITSTTNLSGGCINRAAKITYEGQDFFVKWNHNPMLNGLMEAEAAGMQLLSSANAVKTPQLIGSGFANGIQYLVLGYIDQRRPTGDFWKNFGEQLAQLHQNSAASFGLSQSNYIGSLVQSNRCWPTWPDFFKHERLQPLITIATKERLIDAALQKLFDRLFERFDQLFPSEKPALLHGDLWSGNYLCNRENQPVLIDPAVYYGYHEMDLAMTRLFGGFPQSFYEAYDHYFPLEKDWQQRIDLCNLYPLLVHAILFGESYIGQICQNLQYLLR